MLSSNTKKWRIDICIALRMCLLTIPGTFSAHDCCHIIITITIIIIIIIAVVTAAATVTATRGVSSNIVTAFGRIIK
jgi:hypothetical protein